MCVVVWTTVPTMHQWTGCKNYFCYTSPQMTDDTHNMAVLLHNTSTKKVIYWVELSKLENTLLHHFFRQVDIIILMDPIISQKDSNFVMNCWIRWLLSQLCLQGAQCKNLQLYKTKPSMAASGSNNQFISSFIFKSSYEWGICKISPTTEMSIQKVVDSFFFFFFSKHFVFNSGRF